MSMSVFEVIFSPFRPMNGAHNDISRSTLNPEYPALSRKSPADAPNDGVTAGRLGLGERDLHVDQSIYYICTNTIASGSM